MCCPYTIADIYSDLARQDLVRISLFADVRRQRQAGRGAWLPTRAVEALAQFARRLSLDATWGDLQQLMLQVHQASSQTRCTPSASVALISHGKQPLYRCC